MEAGKNQAISFSLAVNEIVKTGKKIEEAIIEALVDYPGHSVGNGIDFPDGSKATLRGEGFLIKHPGS